MPRTSSKLCAILPLQMGLCSSGGKQEAALAETLTGMCISFWGSVHALRVLGGASQLAKSPYQARGAVIPLSCSEVAISALQEIGREKDSTCPLFLIKRSSQTASTYQQPPCFPPGFWRWECPSSERSWTPQLALFNAVAGSRQLGFQDACSHERKVLHDFSYFLWCRNCGPRVKFNDNFISPCFLLGSGMKVTKGTRFQRGIKERLCS